MAEQVLGDGVLLLVPKVDKAAARQVGSQAGNEVTAGITGKPGRMRSAGKQLMTGLGLGLGAGFTASVAPAIGSFARDVLTMGGSLEQIERKADTVFGETRSQIDAWAKDNARSFGLTRSELTNVSASFADLLVPMGFTRQEAADLTTETVGLSGALAEWSQGQYDASEVASILSKAMLGEREQLKTLGISINQAEVDTRALAIAQADGRDEITSMDKAVATQQLTFERSQDAQAAFIENTDSATRKQAELRARTQEAKEAIGRGLVPVLETSLTVLTGVFDIGGQVVGMLADNKEAVIIAGGAWAAFVGVQGIGKGITALSNLSTSLGAATKKAGGFTNLLRTQMTTTRAWGLAAAGAVGVVTWAIMQWRDREAEVKERVDAANTALRDQVGVLDLAAEGWSDYALAQVDAAGDDVQEGLDAMGLSLSSLNDLLLEGQDGLDRFLDLAIETGEIDVSSGFIEGNKQLVAFYFDQIEALDVLSGKQLRAMTLNDDLSDSLREQARAALAAETVQGDLAEAYQKLVPALQAEESALAADKAAKDAAAAATEQYGDDTKDATTEVGKLSREVGKLKEKLDLLFGVQKSLDDATLSYFDNMQNLGEATNETGGEVSILTEEGRDLFRIAQDAASSVRDLALAELEAGEAVEDVDRKTQIRIAGLRTEFRELGFTTGETERLIETYARVPRDVQSRIDSNAAAVAGDVGTLEDKLRELDGKVTTTTVRTIYINEVSGRPVQGNPIFDLDALGFKSLDAQSYDASAKAPTAVSVDTLNVNIDGNLDLTDPATAPLIAERIRAALTALETSQS